MAQPLVIQQFLGINNVSPKNRLKAGELLVAQNCDIDDTRAIARRSGIATTPVHAAVTGTHSLFAPFGGAPDLCLFREGGTLYRLMPDLTTIVALKTGLAVGARMHYGAAPTRVFMSDGLWAGWTDGEVVRDWGIVPPAQQPVAAVVSGGRVPKGKYLYAVTYLRADGEESGTGESGAIELNAVGGISFTNVPVSAQADVVMKAVYLTKPNGKDLYRAFLLPAAATSGAYYGTTSDFRVQLETQFLRNPPPGRVIEHMNGRMLVGDGRFVWYNPIAYRHELFSVRAVTAHATNVAALAAMDDGVFVGTESKIDFHSGADYAAANVAAKAGYGACFGGREYVEGARVTDGSIPGRAALLVTKRGIAVCGNGGVFRNLTESRYLYGAPHSVATVARDMGGWSQLLAVMR